MEGQITERRNKMIDEEYSETYFKGYKDGWSSFLLMIRNILAKTPNMTLQKFLKKMEDTPEEMLRRTADVFKNEH